MADEERREDEAPVDEPVAEDAPAEDAAADEPAAEEAPAEEAPTGEPDAEEAPAAEAEADEAPTAAADAPAEKAETKPAEGKKSELPPGAELDPIALEPERELSAEERARLEAEEEERRRREAAEEEGDEPVARRQPQVQLSDETRIQATGKRKSSIARVVVVPGSGSFEVNSRPLDEYFPRHAHQTAAKQPLVTAGYEGTVDVRARVHGGGISGQAGAVRHGVARALVEIDPELRPELKRRGLLTRDAREKERRKAGLKKARKRPQFSKR
jgi:small subunit ribosomal protein S9